MAAFTFMFAMVLAANLLASDAVRDAFDPRMASMAENEADKSGERHALFAVRDFAMGFASEKGRAAGGGGDQL